MGLQFEIRLAQAEIEAPSDVKLPAQSKGARLVELESDAKNSGYLLIATQAEHLGSSPSPR